MDDIQGPECTEPCTAEPSPLTDEALARVAKGLAHPVRVHIVEQCADHRPRMVHEIVEGCTMAQSTVSEHLRILRDAGLVFARTDGPRVWYCLRRSVMRQFAQDVRNLASDRAHLG